jgi:hypothetical protein
MSNSEDQSQCARLIDIYSGILEIVNSEHGKTWSRGIEESIKLLKIANDSEGEFKRERLKDVFSIYNTMNAGSGSFSDFHIWRDNYEERVKANKPLEELRDKLWAEISSLGNSVRTG